MKRNKFNFKKQRNKKLAKQLRDTNFYDRELKLFFTFLSHLDFTYNKQFLYYPVQSNGVCHPYHTKIKKDIDLQTGDKSLTHYYKRKKWNPIKKRYEIKDTELIIDDLLKHVYPYELKNAVPKSLYKSKYVYNKDEKINMHMIDYSMFGGQQVDNSQILALDIDCHDGATLLTYQNYMFIKEHIIKNNGTIVYSERSREGGYHIYIKLDKLYTREEKKEWFNQFKKMYNIQNVDLPSSICFPCSILYQPIDENEEIISYKKAITKTIRKVRSDEYSGYILNYPSKEKKIEKNNVIEFPVEKTIQTYTPSAIFTRTKKQKNNNEKPVNFKIWKINEYIKENKNTIYRNNRHYKMLETIRTGIFAQWTTEEILYTIRKINNPLNSSRDLERWSDLQLYDQIESAKKACNIKPPKEYLFPESNNNETYCPDSFISNIQYIPKHVHYLITNKKIIDFLIIESGYKLTEKNRNKYSIIFQEIIGQIYYNAINERQTKSNHTDRHIIGVQFSEQYAFKLKKYYPELNNTDVHGIIKLILKNEKFFKQYYINKRGWQYFSHNKKFNYCKQYDLKTNKNHSLLNSIDLITYYIYHIIIINNNYFSIQDIFMLYSNNVRVKYENWYGDVDDCIEYYEDTG